MILLLFAIVIFCAGVVLLLQGIDYLVRIHKAKLIILRYKMIEICKRENLNLKINKDELIEEIKKVLSKGL